MPSNREDPPGAHLTIPQAFQQYGGTYGFGRFTESHLIPPSSLYVVEKSSFPGSTLPNNTVHSKSLVEVKPGDSGVVIRYHINGFTFTWLAENFIAHSQIYPGFTSKVSTLTHFPLDEADAIPSSVPAGFLHSVNTVSINSKPQLAPSIRYHIMPNWSFAFACFVASRI